TFLQKGTLNAFLRKAFQTFLLLGSACQRHAPRTDRSGEVLMIPVTRSPMPVPASFSRDPG
ncbi:hypothetical protein, partial [Neglectibacter timonensis]|uniref:hypothetical protein n=1 Tax=Neglectibacter timonensis TaxID=1776382 RepID=UPI003219961F